MVYPQQYPTYPQPTYPQAPQQQVFAPTYPQQPYQPQYAPQAPVAPVANGTLDGFFSQPSSAGGPSLKFNGKPIGTAYVGIVARKIGDGDIRQQTNQAGQPVTYKDGRPKWIMVVPLIVPASPEFPEGRASWWVKGQARDELVRAMAEAGAPEGPPEEGAAISITLVGQRPIPNMNPQLQYAIRYQRPNGAAPVAPAPAQPAPPVEQVQQPVAPQVQMPQPPAQQVVPQQPAQVPQAAPAAPQPPADLSPEQQQLLARLTGNGS